MKWLVSVFLLFAAWSAHADDLYIKNVSIISAHLNAVAHNQNVLIQNGRIASISAQPVLPSNVEIIDGTGKFLTPGLMDSHVHVNAVPGIGFFLSDKIAENKALVDEYFAQQPRSFLYHGVTQLVNLGSDAGVDTFTSHQIRPDLFKCLPIPNIGGYPDTDAAFTLRNSSTFVLEAGHTHALPDGVEPSNHTPEMVVNRIADAGAKCVKIYIEDGFGANTGFPILRDATITMIRIAAKKRGLPIAAHANAIDMHQIALRNKVDILAHGIWNWQWPADKGEPPIVETLEQIIENGTSYMPTIQVMAGLGGVFSEEVLSDPKRKRVMPASLLAWYETEEGQWFKRELKSDFGPDTPDEQIHEIFGYGVGRVKRATKYLYDKGHPLLLASDFPSSPTYAIAPGLTTYHEMVSMFDAGVSLQAIFEAGTINNAKEFTIDGDYGTVEAGKVANLLLLNANPLEDIAAWDDIKTIILHGRPIVRATLAVQ